MNKPFEIYWGIDVSKAWLDIDTGEQITRINQDRKAIKAFIKKHKKVDSSKILVVLESTGGYEQVIVRCLSEEGLVVHVAHPNKVKAFAKAKGQLAKSDKIDARILREYGFFISANEIKPLPSAKQHELQLLGARLEQLKEMHHQESCRLVIASEKAVKKSIQGVLKLLKTQMEVVKTTIANLIDSDESLTEKYAILCSMKGVGPMLAMKLITDLPELGKANKKEIAALVGVAPITHESGQKIGKAMIKYGRFSVRKVLYMGALVASRYNPKFQAFYMKLIAAGKPPKVALIAVMRKMIVILNVMIQTKKHFYA
jgi:transposase